MTVVAVAASVAYDLASAAVVAAEVACDLAAPVVVVAAVVAHLICILLTAVELKLHASWLCVYRGTLVVTVVVAVVEVVTLAQVTMLPSCQRFVVRCSRGEAVSRRPALAPRLHQVPA